MENENNNLNENGFPGPKKENAFKAYCHHLKKNAKRDFFYGLFVILPLLATIALVLFSINVISGPVSALFDYKIHPLFSFLLTLLIITIIGITARNIIGKAFFNLLDSVMHNIPFVSIFYKSAKQIIHAISFQRESNKFLSAVLVEYPRKGLWVLAYITKENNENIYDQKGRNFGEDKYALFIPTTPNPTSGFLIYVNKSDVIKLNISIEESVRMIMSAGVLTPKTSHKPVNL
ncbi:DUF502 domain-containing protein [Candidatus Margulisiibacteriota bacterium]